MNSIGERRGLLLDGPRLVFHYHITEDATSRLYTAFVDSIETKNQLDQLR